MKGETNAPDWARFDREILCPLCGYNLRGLIDARCPECGSQYLWAELLNPLRNAHPYLFEHHPERNWWSFRRTLWGGMLPRRFWTELTPSHAASTRRLAIYSLCCIFVSYLFFLVALIGYDMVLSGLWWRGATFWGHVQRVFGLEITPANLLTNDRLLLPFLLPIVWAGFTYCTFAIFRTSFRRASIRRVQSVRVVVYVFDAIVLFWACQAILNWVRTAWAWSVIDDVVARELATISWVPLVSAWYLWFFRRPEYGIPTSRLLLWWPIVTIAYLLLVVVFEKIVGGGEFEFGIVGAGPVSSPVIVWVALIVLGRLVTAHREYLKIRRAWAVVLLSQLVVALTVKLALSFHTLYRLRGVS